MGVAPAAVAVVVGWLASGLAASCSGQRPRAEIVVGGSVVGCSVCQLRRGGRLVGESLLMGVGLVRRWLLAVRCVAGGVVCFVGDWQVGSGGGGAVGALVHVCGTTARRLVGRSFFCSFAPRRGASWGVRVL